MPEVDPPRLVFGTTAAVFESPQVAQRAVDALAQRGYPRDLMTVLTGQPWERADGSTTGILPDAELRFQLVPATPHDRLALRSAATTSPALTTFASSLLQARQRANPAVLPLFTLVIAVVAVLITLFSVRDWLPATVVALIALHVVVGVTALSFGREHAPSFPFRSRIPAVEEALERGGALVTVRCTLPYRSVVEEALTRAGGEVLGHAPRVAYPVPVA
jgi:hypothetical protein